MEDKYGRLLEILISTWTVMVIIKHCSHLKIFKRGIIMPCIRSYKRLLKIRPFILAFENHPTLIYVIGIVRNLSTLSCLIQDVQGARRSAACVVKGKALSSKL